MPDPDPLAPLRLFADLRRFALALADLDDPSPAVRAKVARRPDIHHAVTMIRQIAENIVGPFPGDDLFWQHQRETRGAAEKRFDRMRAQLRGEKADDKGD